MSPRYSNLLNHPATGEDALIQRQMLETIESIRHTVRASHRTMDDARDAIARADKALAGRTRVCALSTGGGSGTFCAMSNAQGVDRVRDSGTTFCYNR